MELLVTRLSVRIVVLLALAGALGCHSAEPQETASEETRPQVSDQTSDETPRSGTSATRGEKGGTFKAFIFNPGAEIPTIKGVDPEGRPVTIVPERPVFVHFYSTWDDCEQELGVLADIERKYGPSGLRIIGVASVHPDDIKAWSAYLEAHEVTWSSVADTDGSASKPWGATRKAVGNASDFSLTYFLGERGHSSSLFVASLFREQYDNRVLEFVDSLRYGLR